MCSPPPALRPKVAHDSARCGIRKSGNRRLQLRRPPLEHVCLHVRSMLAIPTCFAGSLVVLTGKAPTMGLLGTSTLRVGRRLSSLQKRIWLSIRISCPCGKPIPFWGTVTVDAGVPFTSHENPLPPAGVMVGVGVANPVGVGPVAVAVGVGTPPDGVIVAVPGVAVLVDVAPPVAVPVGVTMPVAVVVPVAVTVPVGPAVPPQKSDGIAARGSPHSGSARELPSMRATSASFFHSDCRKHCVYWAPKSLYVLSPTKLSGSVKAKPRQPSLGQSTIEIWPTVGLVVPLANWDQSWQTTSSAPRPVASGRLRTG